MSTPTAAHEAWLRGPIAGVSPLLMPAAHALVQARDDIEGLRAALRGLDLWKRPGGAASLGFHLRHVAGALDRLFTYARGERLDPAQRQTLAREQLLSDDTTDADRLVVEAVAAIDKALDELRRTPDDSVFEPRSVGRSAMPSNVLGLLFHGAEHTTRHVGQLITMVKVVSGA
jgi:uncharacterized damage-inducible protein DinB